MTEPDYSDLDDLDQGVKLLPDLVPGRVIHIDGDILAYNCAGNDETPATIARRNLLQRIENLKFYAGAGRAVVHCTHQASTKGNRFDIAKTQPYQGQRKHSRRPKNWQYLREVLEEHAGGYFQGNKYMLWEDREADDGMSIAAWEAEAKGESDLCVISSGDKDLRQLPGWYVDWNTGEFLKRQHNVLPALAAENKHRCQGLWFLVYQLLVGDDADFIPGIERIPGSWLLKNTPHLCSKRAIEGKDEQKDKPCGEALAMNIIDHWLECGVVLSAAIRNTAKLYRAAFAVDGKDRFYEQWDLLCLDYRHGPHSRRYLLADILGGKYDATNCGQ